MFKFTNNTFHVTRGDKGSITIAYADGAELPGTICFRVYEKDGLDSKPIINKEIEIDDNLTSYELVLTSEDTYKFDNPSGSESTETLPDNPSSSESTEFYERQEELSKFYLNDNTINMPDVVDSNNISNIKYFNGSYYCLVKDILDINSFVDYGEFVHGEDVLTIIDKSYTI